MTHFTKKHVFITAGILVAFLLPLLFLFIASSRSGKKQEQAANPTPVVANLVTPTPSYLVSLLSFRQESATSAAIVLDTGNKDVTAVQLEVSFDPMILTNITVKPGSFFEKAYVLLSNIDYNAGSIFYAVVMPPDGMPKHGVGTVARIYYTFNSGAINPTILKFLPRTKVAAAGIDQSVLKQAESITVAPSF